MRFAPERFVRPFVDIDSAPINRVFRRPDPAPDLPDAFISWGAASNFLFPPLVIPQSSSGGGIRINWPDTESDLEPTEAERVWTEVRRETSPLRVENPQDASQFVIVERIDEVVMMDNREGGTVTLRFNNP
jgi:hypothetical protein